MAKQFWSEVHDLHAPQPDVGRRSRGSRSRKKAVRKVAASKRTGRRVA